MVFFICLIHVLVFALIVWWLCKKKCGEKFSIKYIAALLVLGFLSLGINVLFNLYVWNGDFRDMPNHIMGAVLTALLSAGLIEEVSKYLMFRIAVTNKNQVSTWFDAVLVSSIIAMGFTVLENIVYSLDGDPGSLLRLFHPCHMVFGAIMGYFYGKAMVKQKPIYHVFSILVPVLVHASYDVVPINIMTYFGGMDTSNLSESELGMAMEDPFIIGLVIMFIVVMILFTVIIVMTFKRISKCSAEQGLQEPLYSMNAHNSIS